MKTRIKHGKNGRWYPQYRVRILWITIGWRNFEYYYGDDMLLGLGSTDVSFLVYEDCLEYLTGIT